MITNKLGSIILAGVLLTFAVPAGQATPCTDHVCVYDEAQGDDDGCQDMHDAPDNTWDQESGYTGLWAWTDESPAGQRTSTGLYGSSLCFEGYFDGVYNSLEYNAIIAQSDVAKRALANILPEDPGLSNTMAGYASIKWEKDGQPHYEVCAVALNAHEDDWVVVECIDGMESLPDPGWGHLLDPFE